MKINNLSLENKNILITGGAGFIGSNLALAIQKKFPSSKIFIFDKYDNNERLENGNLVSFGSSENLIPFKGQLIHGDLRSDEELKKLFEIDYDYIFHQAAISDTTATDEKLIYDTNVQSFHRFLNYVKENNTRLIYASSAATYGNAKTPQTVGKENPQNLYAKSKLEMDNISRDFLKSNPNKKVFGLRYFNVYGPNEFHKGKTASMVLQLGLQILDHKKPKLFEGSNLYLRDFVYVEDIVQGNLLCAESKYGGVYNIGYGKSRSFQDISDILQKLLGTNLKNHYVDNPYKNSYQSNTLANIQETVSKLKYRPMFELEEGISDYLNEIIQVYKSLGNNNV